MTGLPLILAFIVAIVLMIVMISKFKIHPFISIMLISVVLGIIAGIPIVDQTLEDGTKVSGLASVIGAGFSGTFSSIGIVIILGALIGSILEQTGAALKLADMVIKLVGKNHPVLAMELMGWVVSIPVFCDSGFVILNPIRKALVQRTGASSVAMSIGLGSGLYIAHVFIPPTPGPIAAANTLGIGDNLLLVMGLGVVCSIFPLAAGYFFSNFIGKKVKAADEADRAEVTKTYEELVAEYGKLPSGISALAPIIVPIILMGISSAVSMAGGKGFAVDLIKFLGTPIIALAVGTVFAAAQLAGAGKMSEFYNIHTEDRRSDPVRDGSGRCARQGHFLFRHGQLHFTARNGAVHDGHLLPVPAVCDLEIRTGFLYGRPYDNGRYRCSAASDPRLYDPGTDHTGLHGNRCRRDDGIPRERFLFLGRHELWRDDTGSGI